MTDDPREAVAGRLVELRVVPAEKPGDALQMAACAAHRIDYLLSWLGQTLRRRES